jgi:hypothetical protein
MYNAQLSITVPDTLKEIAEKIGKALDPDSGGEYSFTDRGDGTINVTTPCTLEFKQQAEYMMAHPELLHHEIGRKYAARWPDFTAPTLAECELFCSSIILPKEVTE